MAPLLCRLTSTSFMRSSRQARHDVVSLTRNNQLWKVEAKPPIILVVKIQDIEVDLRDREDNLQDLIIADKEGPGDGF